MAKQKQPNQTAAGTNIQHVKQRNAQSAGGAGAQGAQQQYGAEFAAETDAQHVIQQNQQSAQKKQQASTQASQKPQQ